MNGPIAREIKGNMVNHHDWCANDNSENYVHDECPLCMVFDRTWRLQSAANVDDDDEMRLVRRAKDTPIDGEDDGEEADSNNSPVLRNGKNEVLCSLDRL
ncbi:hypothetical protein DM860_008873 [Cuscuta australis]|uniref:Uncharacterized protein n=1 Tax=Cuscuta australis TaxID=267555 RepID=A0A328DBK6_9ASTE|nr:hypothetical protein DM860_008873 [Cuscuta australis]